MIVSHGWDHVQAHHAPRDNGPFRGHVTDIIGSLEEPRGEPQAFVVEQAPNWTLRPHYHLMHQFQVAIAGSGMLGRHPLAPFTVHYASPESGYGPIVSGDQGLTYITIRQK